jgi:flagellar biosynthesis GTPase FlhF
MVSPRRTRSTKRPPAKSRVAASPTKPAAQKASTKKKKKASSKKTKKAEAKPPAPSKKSKKSSKKNAKASSEKKSAVAQDEAAAEKNSKKKQNQNKNKSKKKTNKANKKKAPASSAAPLDDVALLKPIFTSLAFAKVCAAVFMLAALAHSTAGVAVSSVARAQLQTYLNIVGDLVGVSLDTSFLQIPVGMGLVAATVALMVASSFLNSAVSGNGRWANLGVYACVCVCV